MAITRPTGEQLRFVSANTGEHVLDTYMENAEIGGRELQALLGDIFDASTGVFDASIFSFRVDTTDDNKLQVRVTSGGSYVDTGVEIFNFRGAHTNTTAYKVLDVVTDAQDTFVCTVAHTSTSSTPSGTNFTRIIDGSLVEDWASKTDGIVDGTDYSSKAWAIGGTGVTDTANAGAAKEWATKTSGTVDGTSYSAKYWATSTDVTTVSSNISDIQTVATDIANVNTVAGINSDVTTVSGINADVTAVAADATDIGTVSTNISNVNTVAGISSDVTAVAADATDIGTVATDITGSNTIGAVAGSISNVNTVAGIDTNITTVANNDANITTVAGISGNVTTVAGISANVTTVSGIQASVTAVANDATDIGTVATDLAGSDNIGTVAGSISSVNTVAGNNTNVTAVGTNIANVNTVATNISDVNSFADTYFISATAPSSPTEGDLWYDTTNDEMKVYNGTSWVSSTAFQNAALSDLGDVSATSPTANQAPVYNGSSYVPTTLSLQAITDIGATTTNTITVATPTTSSHAATKAYVDQEVAAIVDSAPAALDTLNELSAALNDDANFATTVNNSIATKLSLSGGTLTGDVSFGDNDKAIFGAGSDLQIYHDGTNSYISELTPTGSLFIDGSNIFLRSSGGEEFLKAVANAQVELYYNDAIKLATTSTGIDVTGTVTADGLTIDGTADFNNNKITDATLENFQEVMASNTSVSGAVTIPDATNNVSYTLTGNTTVTLPDTDELPSGTARTVTIFVKQDGTGGRSFTFAAPAGYSIKYNNSSTQPAVNTTANKETIYTALLVKGSTTIYVSLSFYEA